MYRFFKSVLENVKQKHREALAGKSGSKPTLQKALLKAQNHLRISYENEEMTKEEYYELAKEFNKINFNDLAAQRKGRLNL